MKTYAYLLVIPISIFLMTGCNIGKQQQEEKGEKLSFDIKKSENGRLDVLLHPKSVIPLAFSDSTMIDGNAHLLHGDDSYIVYSPGTVTPVMRFAKDGQFLNYIGKIGIGPSEYNEISDVSLNSCTKNIEVLSGSNIHVYSGSGKYVEQVETQLSAFSFAIDDLGNHWFYLGNNSNEGSYKLAKMDSKCTNPAYLLSEKSMLLPMAELNFGKGKTLVFKEMLSHRLYKIINGELVQSYLLDFPNYHFPDNLHKTSPMEAVALLQRSNYASVLFCSENAEYLFLQIMLHASGEAIPQIYYWIYQKATGNDVIINLEHSLPVDSYIYFPQYLTDENCMCFLGYLDESNDVDRNPSIAIIDVGSFFK